MRELWLEMWHDMHPDSKSKFVTKGLLQFELPKQHSRSVVWDSAFQITNRGVLTAFRGPLRNEDCRWDYGKARCGFPEHCEYRSAYSFSLFPFNLGEAPFLTDCKSRYVFGDVHLGMSCRLKNTSTNLLQQYLWSMCIALIPFCSCWWELHLTFSSDICRCFGPSNIVVCCGCMGMIFDFPFWFANDNTR